MSRDRAVCVATGYGQEDRGVGVRVPVEPGISTPPFRADRICGPHYHLYDEYRGTFPRGKDTGT
jgi:hypothetical protein